MKRFLDTLRNIWTIEELRQRILVTLGLVLIYRLGSYVVLPGVNVDALNAASNSDAGGIVGLINMFAGGAFLRASILLGNLEELDSVAGQDLSQHTLIFSTQIRLINDFLFFQI